MWAAGCHIRGFAPVKTITTITTTPNRWVFFFHLKTKMEQESGIVGDVPSSTSFIFWDMVLWLYNSFHNLSLSLSLSLSLTHTHTHSYPQQQL